MILDYNNRALIIENNKFNSNRKSIKIENENYKTKNLNNQRFSLKQKIKGDDNNTFLKSKMEIIKLKLMNNQNYI